MKSGIVTKKTNSQLALKELLDMDTPDIRQLTPDQQKAIYKAVAVDDLKKQFTTERVKSKFHLSDFLEDYLSSVGKIGKQSEKTLSNYKRALSKFLNYINTKDVHYLDVSRDIARDYLNTLMEKGYGGGTIRAYLDPVRASYNYLVFEKELLQKNPFSKMKRPPATNKKPLYLLTDSDIDNLFNYMLEQVYAEGRGAGKAKLSAPAMINVVTILKSTGLRAGAVCTIKFKQNNTIEYISKGKKGKLTLDGADYNLLKVMNLSGLNPARIQRYLERAGKALNVGNIYHPHNFRHYFAVNHYRTNKDIYALKDLLNHSSILVTEKYLRTLGEIK